MNARGTVDDVLQRRAKWSCLVGDCRERLRDVPDGSVQCVVTSPPYFNLRTYTDDPREIGREPSPTEFVAAMVAVFREVRRVLANDGVLWINLGDSFASAGGGSAQCSTSQRAGRANVIAQERRGGTKPPDGYKAKDLLGIPWRVAFALQDDGWWLRSDVIWQKENGMPESVADRPTRAHEYVFLMAKSERYFYDDDAIREPHQSSFSKDAIRLAGGITGGERPEGNNFNKEARHKDAGSTPRTRAERAALLNPNGRNCRDVWSFASEPYEGSHFAVMPKSLARRCVLAGSRKGDVVLDPFHGAGTTCLVSLQEERRYIGCELNPAYVDLSAERLAAFEKDATSPVKVVNAEWGDLFATRVGAK